MSLGQGYSTARAMLEIAHVVVGMYARAAFSVCSGRGYVGLQGLVYGATTPTSDAGFVKVDTLDVAIPPTVRALPGAHVVIEPWLPEERAQHAAVAQAAVQVVTGKDGHFMASRAVPVRRRAGFTVTVTAEGFESLEGTFRPHKVMHQAIIVMVPSARH